ncbi:cell envelope integrity protein CreD [Methylomonas albis]|uniref:Cell envelope integrity protein CreD n=1 Tax=Methylomonas albis TaxID=1854563 RepID=A0ABR9D0G3_9GAMM|nr:cell envelope integrity protein CreD [Methylomonas albis]MBD9356301.1 cell envelope integrity protein CreD [Methylomonas albis]
MQKKLWQKICIMFGLTLVLLIPIGMVKNLVSERAERQQQTVSDIAASSADPQQLFGPLLVVPYTERWTEIIDTKVDGQPKRELIEHNESRLLYFLPEHLNIAGELATETKQRGLFKVRSYVLNVSIKGDMSLPGGYGNPKPLHNGQISFGTPYASVVLADMRGVLEAPGMAWAGKHYAFEQGAELPMPQAGMHVTLDAPPVEFSPINMPFAFTLKIRGIESLDFIPAGKQTRVELSSAWQHPSFYGRFLPDPQSQQVGETGFHALWSVDALASNVAESLYKCHAISCYDSFGIRLMEPINVYSLSDRASKYGFLFVCLTFAAIFLFEILKNLAIHPAQYALVGLALAMFFLLLLSLSEHLDFVLAYLIASAACVTLIGFYLSAVLRSIKRGIAAGALLGGLFGSLYGLLESEDNALMLGSLLMFALLALAMVTTRRLDWYGLGQSDADNSAII